MSIYYALYTSYSIHFYGNRLKEVRFQPIWHLSLDSFTSLLTAIRLDAMFISYLLTRIHLALFYYLLNLVDFCIVEKCVIASFL